MPKYILALLFVCAFSAEAQWPSRPATDQDSGVATDNATTTLTGAILSTDLTLPVQNGLVFHQYNILTIDSEQMMACGVATNTVTICAGKRGLGGTAPAAHLNGAQVDCDVNAVNFNWAKDEIKSIEATFAAQVAAHIPASPVDFYQSVKLGGGAALPQRPTLHFTEGPNTTLVISDDAINNWTDVDLSALCGGGTGTNYQSFQVAGVSTTQEPIANFVSANANLGIVPTTVGSTTVLTFTVPNTAGTATHFTGFPHAYSAAAGHCTGTTASSDWDTPVSGGAHVDCHGVVPRWAGPDFDATLNEIAYLHLMLSPNWVAGSTIGLSLTWWNSANTNSTTWSAQTICAVSGVSVVTGTISANAAQTVTTANNGTANTENHSTLPALSATGCVAGNEVWIKLQRTDAFSGEAGLIGRTVTLQETF